MLGPNLVLCELRNSTKNFSKNLLFFFAFTHTIVILTMLSLQQQLFLFFHFATLIKTLPILLKFHTKSPVGCGMEKLENIRDFSFLYLSLVERWKSAMMKTSLFA